MPVNFKGGLLVNGESVTTETEVETLQEELDTKAVLGAFNGGGTGVDYADLAINLKTEQGASVEDAIAQLSPISVAVGDGDFAEMTNVKGRSLAYNQLMSSIDNINWQAAGGTVVKNNNIINLTITTTSNQEIYAFTPSGVIKNGNKYLCFVEIKSPRVSNCRFTIAESNWSSYNSVTTGNSNDANVWSSMAAIINIDHSFSGAVIHIYPLNSASNDEVGDELQFRNVQIFDLTAMGLDSVTTVEEAYAALRSYGIEPTVYNEYSAGKIIDSQPNKIISRGFNQWDEEWENGGIGFSDGVLYNDSTKSRTLNFTKVFPNGTYYVLTSVGIDIHFYDKNQQHLSAVHKNSSAIFTTPESCYYIKFMWNSPIYNHDICINISDPALNGTYKPFVKDEHALTLPVMRSAGSVYDDKDMVRVGTIDLGSLSFTYDTNYYTQYSMHRWLVSVPTNMVLPPNNSSTINLISSLYKNRTINDLHQQNLQGIGVATNGNIYVYNGSNTIKPSGTINYELATPVAQDPVINLPHNIKVYNGGTLETQYESPNTTPALVSMLYQVNLKNFVEGVGSKEDINWDPQNIASKTDLAPKANTEDIKSGELVARLADDLTPYSDASGAEQTNPFIINGTGTNNNTEIVTVGTYAFLKEKQGNTLVVNQLAKAINSTNWGSSDNTKGTVSFNGGEITYSIITPGVSYVNGIRSNLETTGKPSHIYVLLGEFKSNKNGVIKLGIDILNIPINYQPFATLTTSYALYGVIINATNNSASSGSIHICTRSTDGVEEGDNFTSRNIILVDLTQMFSSNDKIPQDLLDNPSHFFWYYNGSLDRNTGTLENSNGVKLVSTGRNIWDEEWEKGTYNADTGVKNNADRLRCKNPIRVVPGSTYYFKVGTNSGGFLYWYDAAGNYLGRQTQSKDSTFIVPNNAVYMTFNMYSEYGDGTTYNHDITITPYYTPAQGGEGYGQYYPHEEPHVIDTGTEVLRSAGTARDSKAPDGIITRRIVSYTFTGNESNIDVLPVNNNETARGNGKFTIQNVTNILPGIKSFEAATYTKPNILFSEYETIPSSGLLNSTTIAGNMVASTYGTYLYFEADKFKGKTNAEVKQMLAGLTVYVEMATPTTEQGTPFNESISINDYGMLYWLDENDELVEIAQGAKIFYPVNYKGFMDDLYSRVDGDSGAYATFEDLTLDNIVDSHGRKRFIEGGMTKEQEFSCNEVYTKWSLSGTHLMIVLTIEAATDGASLEVPQGYIFSLSNLPLWVVNKITPLWGNNIDKKVFSVYHSSNSSISLRLQKLGNQLVIYSEINSIHIAQDSTVKPIFRAEFDLLIDLDV